MVCRTTGTLDIYTVGKMDETKDSLKKEEERGFPRWSSGWHSVLPMQGVWGLIPGQGNRPYLLQPRVHMFQLTPGTAKYINEHKYYFKNEKEGKASLVAQLVKNLPAMRETWVWFLGREDPLEEGMATHSSILAWRIPWTEEPGGLQSMGSKRVGHD